MEINKKKITEDELVILDAATEDFLSEGASGILCPRCGKKLDFESRGASCRIFCEDVNCIELTSRGL